MEFSEREYRIKGEGKKLKDARERPRIGVYVVFLSILLLVILRKGSLLQIDQLMRSKGVRKMFGVRGKEVVGETSRRGVCTDSTIERGGSKF